MKTNLMRLAPLSVSLLALVALLSGCNESYGNKIVSADEGRLTISDAQGEDYTTHEVATDATITVNGKPAKLDDLHSGDSVTVKVEDREGLDVATEITASTDATLLEASTAPSTPATPEATTPSDVEKPNATTPPPEESSPVHPSTPPEQPLDEAILPATQPGSAASAPNDEAGAPADDSVHGKIASMADNQIAVKDEAGTDEMVSVNADTKYTLDGEAASFADLAMDQMVTAIGQREGDKFVAKSVAATTQ